MVSDSNYFEELFTWEESATNEVNRPNNGCQEGKKEGVEQFSPLTK